ncbi:hypothetical protein [Actinomadura harenae]|nr:hypothetical protein [Actinomadura harenae]
MLHEHNPDEIPDTLARTAPPSVLISVIAESWETAWVSDRPKHLHMGSVISALARADAQTELADSESMPITDALDVAWTSVERHWSLRMKSYGFLSDSIKSVRMSARMDFIDLMRNVASRLGPVPPEPEPGPARSAQRPAPPPRAGDGI